MWTDFIIWLFMLNIALGLSSQEPASSRSNCIHMTSQKELQIDAIIDKLSGFLNHLSMEHEHFDIRVIKLEIEQHSDGEEEKETLLQLSVNDCQLTDAEVEEIEENREIKHSERQKANDEDRGKNFKVIRLKLQENGQQLMEALDRKSPRPRLVYVEKDRGNLNYLLYKK